MGNYELPGLDIVTCADLLNTNHCTVVFIMNENTIMVKTTPFIHLVKLNGSKMPVMTSPSKQDITFLLMVMPHHFNRELASCTLCKPIDS